MSSNTRHSCRLRTDDTQHSLRAMNRPISLNVCVWFTCTGSSFDEQSRKVDRRRHHIAKQYLCTPSIVFTSQESSTSHRKRQTEEQMYSCNQCGKCFHLTAACISIWIFMQVNSSAQNVANVVKPAMHWQDTGEVIQDWNHLNVLFVANDLQHQVTLLLTAEFTVETNTNVTRVTRRLVSLLV